MSASDSSQEDERALRRAQASSFGGVAQEYDAGRPGYPAAAVRWLVRDAQVIVEIGAGTGKLTASLVAPGAAVVATEPLPEMLQVLRRTVPAASAVAGAAELIPLRSGVADVVVAAQAFHWFDGAATLRSAARVLRPGGAVALVWNSRDVRIDWVAELSEIIGGSEQMAPGWDDCFIGSPFEPLESTRFEHSQPHDAESLVALVQSRSYLVVASEARRAKVLDGVRRLVAAHPDLAGRRSFEMPYVVDCFRAPLRAAAAAVSAETR